MNHTLEEAISAIISLSPLNLDVTCVYPDKETGTPIPYDFSDLHPVTITLPAWVFRTLRTYAQADFRTYARDNFRTAQPNQPLQIQALPVAKAAKASPPGEKTL